ncbi:MAG TPA: hypothetical protein V6D12_05950 [Candidatus Obscuribacterales bacterium]
MVCRGVHPDGTENVRMRDRQGSKRVIRPKLGRDRTQYLRV